jgi:MFS family permease
VAATLRLPTGPIRWIYVSTLALGLGSGAWYSIWAIFFTRSVGLTPLQFGLGVSAAGLVGMVIGSPVGYLADRVGTREVLIGVSVVQGTSTLAYAVVHQFWTFLLASCIAGTAERLAPGIRVAVISGVTERADRLHQISSNRVVSHIGMAAGSGIGALILYLNSRAGYVSLIVLYGVAALASAAMMTRVPHVTSLSDTGAKRPVLVLRDRAFLVVTALSALLALNWGMLGTGVPLWISNHTYAPTWIIGVITGANAVAIVLWQNWVSRFGTTVAGAARLAVWCGLALATSCVLFALTYHGRGFVVILVLLAATGAHVVGELLYVSSGWGLSVALTPEGAHGEYQTVFATGPAVALMVAPALMTSLVVGWGVAGWLLLGAVFLAGSLPTVPVSRWALRTEQRQQMSEST